MLAIHIEAKDRPPLNFKWRGSSSEARRLWKFCEEGAETEGHDPKHVASLMIREAAIAKDKTIRMQAQPWAVYAVLRHATDTVDLTSMFDQAGEAPTIFDLAEHQYITANIVVDEGVCRIKLSGRFQLDS